MKLAMPSGLFRKYLLVLLALVDVVIELGVIGRRELAGQGAGGDRHANQCRDLHLSVLP